MKTTVVPAQITSVEDRIAGNFTFAQILLFIAALLLGTSIYLLVTPRSGLSTLKTILVILQFIFFGGLAIRYQGKILAQWLSTYFRFYNRPRFYIFTKSDLTHREIVLPELKQEDITGKTSEKPKTIRTTMSLDEQLRVERLMGDSSLTLSLEIARKGGIDVSLTPAKE